MNIKTQQIMSQAMPENRENSLSLGLYCQNCATGRIFIVDENMRLLLTKNIRRFSIQSVCIKCGNKMQASFAWIEKTAGWSHKTQAKIEEKVLVVEDDLGLEEFKS